MRERAWSWSNATLVSWAGMRGVVTLAAAFVLPAETPHRDVLVLAAFAVVGGTLLVNGTTLSWLVRRLDLPGPDPAEDALEEAALLSKATRAGLAKLEELKAEGADPSVIQRLEERTRSRADAAWERLGAPSDDETPSELYRRLRQEMLHAERRVVLEARDSGKVDDEVLRDVLTLLDAEESLLDRLEDKGSAVERELVARIDRVEDCEHLKQAPMSVIPTTPEGCEECLRDGTHWVHLRLCLTCGHVGCCDSSPERHADRHFQEAGHHPVMRSFETGEAWRWCYIDERLG
jgi:CPA1 family monovalent cation:H+ antiporter